MKIHITILSAVLLAGCASFPESGNAGFVSVFSKQLTRCGESVDLPEGLPSFEASYTLDAPAVLKIRGNHCNQIDQCLIQIFGSENVMCFRTRYQRGKRDGDHWQTLVRTPSGHSVLCHHFIRKDEAGSSIVCGLEYENVKAQSFNPQVHVIDEKESNKILHGIGEELAEP